MNKFILCLVLLIYPFFKIRSEQNLKPQVQCTKELLPILNTLLQLPEFNLLIDDVLKDGPITIQHNDSLSNKFTGYWDPYHRKILISKKSNLDKVDKTTTLLFEMHNASRSEDFKKIDYLAYKRKISKEQYIRQSEFIEYENCLSTSYLIKKGIQQGIFPKNSEWLVHDNFEDHYDWMKRSGHSTWYSNTYKKMR